ncbi:Dual specificity mitogen-activated protein kinase kinase 5 [Trichoplax sp. H2]|nr:Dual specificity mitogen-activated protein kinase kinase 5 [Trichoplax sp. H2]|eukprot:RDD40670.1 Dual specificity mitogen-activated protein kinase kinase 5 [Trichoplax sp. H2]
MNTIQYNPNRIVLRIKRQSFDGNGDVDWTVDPFSINYQDVLDAISRVLQTTASAFEYEDDDGDRIIVKSDEELRAMINYYIMSNDSRVVPAMPPMLIIYPKVVKTPRKRNVLGLTVNTKAAPAPSVYGVESPMGKHKSGGNLQAILQSGQLMYLDITPDVQKQIMSELDILFKCDSSYIISFYGAFFIENRIAMCTEYMDGGSLDKYGKIPELVLGKVTASVVKGLVYLWNQKIMHRDVKPSNMLVNTQGQVKLCDFGVSVQLERSIAHTYVGTNAYMAPERIVGSEYGVNSEVWSLGLALLEMALGKFPYPTDNQRELSSMAPPTLPSDRFSPEFVNLAALCTRKSPHDRPAPDDLLHHPFICKHDDNDVSIVAAWLSKMLSHVKNNLPSTEEYPAAAT